MKISAKIAVLTSAALLFGASAAVAQDATEETTTTTTTTVTETAISEDGDYVGYEVEGEIAVEGEDTVIEGQTSSVVTKEYDGYLQVPVQTTEETTYTTVIGQPTGRWSASDWFGGKFSFSNKVSSDLVKGRGSLGGSKITGNDTNEYEPDDYFYAVEMGGLYDTVELKYEAKRLRFALIPQFGLDDATENFWSGNAGYVSTVDGLNNDDLALSWTDFDWYIEFLPFDIVGLNLHRNMYTLGSYLPVADNNVEGGNLSSEGFTVAVYPTDNLTLTSTLPFDFDVATGYNWLNAEYPDTTHVAPATTYNVGSETDYYKFNIGFGAEYKIGKFMAIGATYKDMLNSIARQAGLYMRLNIASMYFNLGYTFTNKMSQYGTRFDYWEIDDDALIGSLGDITGRHVVNFAWAWDLGKLDLAVDALFNIFKDQSLYDLYAGLKIGYDVSDAFSFGVKGFGAFDLGSSVTDTYSWTDISGTAATVSVLYAAGLADKTDADSADILVGASPYVTYQTGRNEFGASMVLEFVINDFNCYHVKFPVYWKYTF